MVFTIWLAVFIRFMIIVCHYPECDYFAFENVASYWLFVFLLFNAFKDTLSLWNIFPELEPQCMLHPIPLSPGSSRLLLAIQETSWRMHCNTLRSAWRHKCGLLSSSLITNLYLKDHSWFFYYLNHSNSFISVHTLS